MKIDFTERKYWTVLGLKIEKIAKLNNISMSLETFLKNPFTNKIKMEEVSKASSKNKYTTIGPVPSDELSFDSYEDAIKFLNSKGYYEHTSNN